MNYYGFHIGDYASATQHLTESEDLAYRRLLDLYYLTERPIPNERRQVYRLVRASSEAMREAIDTVLAEFFIQTEDGWTHSRCDAEIAKACEKSRKAKANGRLGAEARAGKTQPAASAASLASASENQANAAEAGSERLAPNPNPNPNSRGEVVARARDPDAELEAKLRQAAGWQNEPAPKLAVTGEIVALIDSGADLDLDVLPTIKALAPRCDGRSWSYFVKPIARQRDARLNASTIVSPPQQGARHATAQQKPSRADTFAKIRARIAEAESGTDQGSDGEHGDPAQRKAG